MAAPSAEELRREFLLDPEVAFLNHGAFGACPRPVFERYQAWQRELEAEPVDFLDRRLPAQLETARAALAEYVGCLAQDIAFIQNATTGVNLAARSLALGPGDEVLATDLEYGACDLAWERVCRQAGARYVRAPIPLPLREPSDVTESLFAHAGDRTRAVYVSHITSSTGLVLPVEEIVARASALELVTIVGGAHAPRSGFARPSAPRRELLQRQRTQMALRTQGRRLPPRSARAPAASRRRHRQLGLPGRKQLLGKNREAGDTRSRSLAHGPGRDPLPDRAQLGRRPRTQLRTGVRSSSRPLQPPRNGTPRTGLDARADGDSQAPPPRARTLRATFRAPPDRSPGRR